MTFMRYFYMGVKLRSMVNKIDWPDIPVYERWFQSFKKMVGEQRRGTRVTDSFSFEFLRATRPPSSPHPYDDTAATALSTTTYESLLAILNSSGAAYASAHGPRITRSSATLPTKGEFVKSIVYEGTRFTAGGRDSFVTYKIQSGGSFSLGAGQIESIFYHRHIRNGETVVLPYAVIQEHQPLSLEHAALDPYRQFEDLNTRLYYHTFDATPRVVPFTDIVAHFAALVYTPEGIEKQCMVVRSLDRVRVIGTSTEKVLILTYLVPTELGTRQNRCVAIDMYLCRFAPMIKLAER